MPHQLDRWPCMVDKCRTAPVASKLADVEVEGRAHNNWRPSPIECKLWTLKYKTKSYSFSACKVGLLCLSLIEKTLERSSVWSERKENFVFNPRPTPSTWMIAKYSPMFCQMLILIPLNTCSKAAPSTLLKILQSTPVSYRFLTLNYTNQWEKNVQKNKYSCNNKQYKSIQPCNNKQYKSIQPFNKVIS